FPEESHDLSRNGRPDRRVERLRRISGWFQRFLGTSAVDRAVAEETTQILPAPVEAARDWAKTIAITNRPATKPVEEPTAPMEIQEPVEGSADAPVMEPEDRKSTRLNSSHRTISYAVFCLKKKKKINNTKTTNTYNTK